MKILKKIMDIFKEKKEPAANIRLYVHEF